MHFLRKQPQWIEIVGPDAFSFRSDIVPPPRRQRLILVCFTERGDVIRIINAREPDAAERHDYEKNIS